VILQAGDRHRALLPLLLLWWLREAAVEPFYGGEECSLLQLPVQRRELVWLAFRANSRSLLPL